jgi:hypothetical protein
MSSSLTRRQTSILNALVTFAAENVPGGLSEDEREVAQLVGDWALMGETPVVQFTNEIPCTCAEDRPAGDPDDHSATCLWAQVQNCMD